MLIKISQLDPTHLANLQMTELLYKNIEDDNETGDVIFVPGSSKAVNYRLPKAIELYKPGRAKILFLGGLLGSVKTLYLPIPSIFHH